MANPTYWHGTIPWVSAKDMKVSRLTDSLMHVTEGAIGNGTRVAPPGAVLIVVRGMILAHTLPVAIAMRDVAFNQDMKALVPAEGVSGEFFLAWLQANTRQVLGIASESTHGTKRIPSGDLFSMSIALPPLVEQEAIAAALYDIDALIDGLERIIAKKRDIKQAAMQQLLTGRTRLPGFSGEWRILPLAQLADIRGGGTPSTTKSEYWNGEIPWCTPTDITHLAGGKYLVGTARSISQSGLHSSAAELIPAGSIVLTTRATIGECAINKAPLATSQGFKNLVVKAFVGVEFLYYLLTTQKAALVSLCAGSTFLEISKAQLGKLELKVPDDRKEQDAIALVLSEVDNELDALEQRLAKTKAIKLGMMQELLTGRTRLVTAKAAHA